MDYLDMFTHAFAFIVIVVLSITVGRLQGKVEQLEKDKKKETIVPLESLEKMINRKYDRVY